MNEKKEPGISYKRFSMDKDWTTLKPLLSEEPKGNPALVRFDWAKQNDLRVEKRTDRLFYTVDQNSNCLVE